MRQSGPRSSTRSCIHALQPSDLTATSRPGSVGTGGAQSGQGLVPWARGPRHTEADGLTSAGFDGSSGRIDKGDVSQILRPGHLR